MNDQQTRSLDTPTHIEVQKEESTPPPAREDRIRVRAYELYEQRNREPGHAEDDWFRAEAEVTGSQAETVTGRQAETEH